MKRTSILIAILIVVMTAWADNKPGSPSKDSKEKPTITANYRYRIVVNSQSEAEVRSHNRMIEHHRGISRVGISLGACIVKAYKTAMVQKTVNASSGLIGFGVNYAMNLMQKNVIDFDDWRQAKIQQCTFTKDLSSEEIIDDFYYMVSTEGAFDPQNMKFNGFTCTNYIESTDPKLNLGHDVFFVSCKLRTDSLGMARMANHSKFMLEVDSLAFYPRYCNIPNNTPKDADDKFNFSQYTDLELVITARIRSSWVNEAVMITNDEPLGDFIIRANIDRNALQEYNGDTIFVFSKNNPKTKELVQIIGESYIVPRSFVGTSTVPVWGTGQYKLDLEVTESCQLKADHYLKSEEVGYRDAVSCVNPPDYEKWEKKVWKNEWKAMKLRNIGNSFWVNAWQSIKTAYIGDNWVKELVDPADVELYKFETQELNKLFKLDE